MARSPRSDIKIGNLEKKLGLAEGAIRNPDGSNARSDKLLKTLRKEYQRVAAGPPVRTSASVKAAAASSQAKKTVPKPAPKAAVSKPIAKPKTVAKVAVAKASAKPAAPKKKSSGKPKK